MSRHNVQIQNDHNSIYVHKRGSSTIDLVLRRDTSNLNCHKGITTTSQNKRPLINNKKYKTKGTNWNAWKTELTSSLNK